MNKNDLPDSDLDAYSVAARALLSLKPPPARRLGEIALYTAAAGSALALAPAAEASIIYSGIQDITVHRVTNGSAITVADLNRDGVNDVQFVIFSSTRADTAAMAGLHSGVSFVKYNASLGIAKFNASSANIGSKQNFGFLGTLRYHTHTAGGAAYGAFNPAPGASVTGFVGAQYTSAGKPHFGWLHLKLDVGSDGRTDDLTLIDWAFESVPGTSIHVGDPVYPSSVPEPSTLGLLALGAAGLAALCRRRGHEKKVDRVH